MTYLIEKYKIKGNAYLCESSMLAAVEIAKKCQKALTGYKNEIL